MTAGPRLARNTLWNVVGLGAPMLAALVATPLLIHGMGAERFGVLTMAWAVIGYFSLFDLGLGRALTQLVAEKMGAGREEEIPALAWTALLLLAVLGVLGAGIIIAVTPRLVQGAFKIPPEMRKEAAVTCWLLALSLPAVTSTAGLRGLLEARHQFAVLNAIRVPMGLVSYLGPLAVLPFSAHLVPITAVLVAGRLVGWAVHFWFCLRVIPELREPFRLNRMLVRSLLRYGGWTTVSSVVSTVMVYLDRFAIGAVLSMSAVAYYVTPFEMVSRLGVIPGALLAVVFPTIASSYARDRMQARALFEWTARAIFLILFPVTVLLVAFAREGLTLWLGAEFASHSTSVLQWIAVSIFINTMGMVPAVGIQGIGRPDLTGWLNVLEMPLYLAVLWPLLMHFGIQGAAMASVLRTGVDTVALFVIAWRESLVDTAALRRIAGMIVSAVVVCLGMGMIEGPAVKVLASAGILCIFGWIGWTRLLAEAERAQLRRWGRTLLLRAPGAEAPLESDSR